MERGKRKGREQGDAREEAGRREMRDAREEEEREEEEREESFSCSKIALSTSFSRVSLLASLRFLTSFSVCFETRGSFC
jgi:hypothetical protein